MKIHKQGYHSITFIILIALVIVAIAIFIKGIPTFLSIILIALAISLVFLVVYFFRYFDREVPKEYLQNDKHYVLVPADGKIAAIEKVQEKMYFNDERIKISIYMDLFNVHVNCVPISGIVTWKRHIYGKNYPAFNPKSSLLNERCYTVIKVNNNTNENNIIDDNINDDNINDDNINRNKKEVILNENTTIDDNIIVDDNTTIDDNITLDDSLNINNNLNLDDSLHLKEKNTTLNYSIYNNNNNNEKNNNDKQKSKGTEVMVVQIAGLIARRIVNFKKKNDNLTKGKELGIIKFGSRVDVYLPLNSKVEVSVGQKVTSVKTLLATFP